jgi:hypothetical protein
MPDQPIQFQPTKLANLANIGTVRLFFGCSGNGGSGYVSDQFTDSHGGGIQTFTNTAAACFTGNDEPFNKQHLDDLAERFADDFMGWFKIQPDLVLAGIAAVKPNGYFDEIEFDYNEEMCKTRVKPQPFNGFPYELMHDDTSCPSYPTLGLMLGKTAGVITARMSEGTFGLGPVRIYVVDTPSKAKPGNTITVMNWYSSQIGEGKYVILGKIGCLVFILAADC